MAASHTRTALMPASTSQLNARPADKLPSKKRKRQEQASGSSHDALFTAQAVSSQQKPESATFARVTTVARANLPLSWLNPAHTQAQVPPGCILKIEDPIVHEELQAVLIARLRPNGGLYALERSSDTTCTAWPLLHWVSEELCHNAADGNISQPNPELLIQDHGKHSRSGSLSGETSARLQQPCSPKKAKNRRGALARMSILTPKDSNDLSPYADAPGSETLVSTPNLLQIDSQVSTPMLETTTTLDDSTHRPHEHPRAQPSLPSSADQQVFRNKPLDAPTTYSPARQDHLDAALLHQQYLDTLYLSKTSLAFYAKGPLSRARAQAKNPDSGIDLGVLKECYSAMVLPTKKIDVKYKDSVSNAVESLSAREAEVQDDTRPTKRKSSKKSKLGKDCLYTGEREMIAQWWDTRELKQPGTTCADARNDELSKAISELRSRETEMQMLLLLEVLHIDDLLSKADRPMAGSPGAKIKVEPVEDDITPMHTKPTRPKRKRDLNAELDATAERLCIWHTVAFEDMLSSPEKVREGSDASTAKSKDKLRDFCRDVIIPFYSAKLPDQAKSVCRKLGGPEISPQRPRSQSSKTSTRQQLSATTKSKPRPALKRSLERVLSEDQTVRHGSPPVLNRSSTAPVVPKLKREPSEIDARPTSRSGIQKSVSFTNREIDLVADAKTHEAKRRKLEKLSTQKKELEEAIDALKKPNRTSAAKAFMDEIERRKVDSKTGVKRAENQIHITATPRRVKSKSSASHDETVQAQCRIPSLALPDPNPIVPSSTLKPPHSHSNLTVPASSKKKRGVLSAIHDTPSRGLSQLSNPLADAVIEATPATNRLRSDLQTDTPLPTRLTAKSGKPVLFTPLKRKDVNDENSFLFKDVPEIPEKAGRAMDRVMGGKGIGDPFGFDQGASCGKTAGRGDEAAGRSIYEALGWDEDDDL